MALGVEVGAPRAAVVEAGRMFLLVPNPSVCSGVGLDDFAADPAGGVRPIMVDLPA